MPFVDVIDNYSDGATGTLTDANGNQVNYSIANSGQTINWHDLDGGARVTADGLHRFTLTFEKAVTGAMMQISSGDSDEHYYIEIDGVTADLQTLIANGDVTMTQSNAATHTIREDGGFAGGHHTDSSIMELTFHIPVTSLGAYGTNGDHTNYDYFEIGLDSTASSVICFVQGTLVRTPRGDVSVENLAVGDLITTLDGENRPLRWIGVRKIGKAELRRFDKLRPVRIPAGTLGRGLPTRDLLVSRQHRLLISSHAVWGTVHLPDALLAAIRLTDLPGIKVDMEVQEVTYFHLLLDKHAVILAEGAPCESLFTGPMAQNALTPHQLSDIRTRFPYLIRGQACRPPIPGKMQTRIVQAHIQTGEALLALYEPTSCGSCAPTPCVLLDPVSAMTTPIA